MKIYRETRTQYIRRLSKGVVVSSVSQNIIHYEVKGGKYTVSFDAREISRPWNCTCVHGSLYRGDKDEHCAHIQAVQLRIKEEGKTTW